MSPASGLPALTIQKNHLGNLKKSLRLASLPWVLISFPWRRPGWWAFPFGTPALNPTVPLSVLVLPPGIR